jgi:hypothetical protein
VVEVPVRKGVEVGKDGRPRVMESEMPDIPPAPEPVKVDLADLAKLVEHAKRQGWI